MGDLDKKSMEAAIDAVYFWADGDARQIAEGVVKAYLAASPSPQTLLRGKDEAEMMVDEFEKAFFSRCMAETDARRKAYEAARSGLIAALSTEGKDND